MTQAELQRSMEISEIGMAAALDAEKAAAVAIASGQDIDEKISIAMFPALRFVSTIAALRAVKSSTYPLCREARLAAFLEAIDAMREQLLSDYADIQNEGAPS